MGIPGKECGNHWVAGQWQVGIPSEVKFHLVGWLAGWLDGGLFRGIDAWKSRNGHTC